MPEDYTQTDSPSAGIEQLIFAAQGPLAAPPARRALALCTPRDVIARNAEVPIANTRLNPVTEEAVGSGESGRGRTVHRRQPRRGRARRSGNQPLAVRIGYQTPERAAGRDRRRDRQVLRARGHRRAGRRLGDHGPAVVAQQRDRRAAGQHRRRHRQRVDRLVGDGRLRPAHRQRQQPVGLLEPADRRHHRRARGDRRSRRNWPGCSARRGRSCGPTCRRCRCTASSAR